MGKFEHRTLSFSGDHKEIAVDLDAAGIELLPAEGDEIVFDFYDDENRYYRFCDLDSSLGILRRDSRPFYKKIFCQSLDPKIWEAKLFIPAGCRAVFDVSTSVGRLRVKGVNFDDGSCFVSTTGGAEFTECRFGGKVNVRSTTGSLRMESCEGAGDVDLETTTGPILVDGVSAAGLSARQTTGSFTVRDVSYTGDFRTERVTGSADVSDSVCGGFTAFSTTGSITVRRLTASAAVDLRATTGSIFCGLTDGRENYSVQSHSVTGSLDVPESFVSGGKMLTVSVVTGSVELRFNDN